MEIKQQIKLSQQLVMTPQLQQAIRLLQLSRLELIDEIRKELDANPVLAHAEPDVRAILLRRSASGYACYLVPVDRCYELVGIVRQSWMGFHGGADVWARVGAFFAELDREARAVDRTGQAVPGA